MTDRQNNSRSALVNTTAYFLERAGHYRFAAAMTTNPYEIERFCELAVMFERMAHETRRSQLCSRFKAEIRQGDQWSSILGEAVGIVKTWVGKSIRSYMPTITLRWRSSRPIANHRERRQNSNRQRHAKQEPLI
jgi:hypothetical protein